MKKSTHFVVGDGTNRGDDQLSVPRYLRLIRPEVGVLVQDTSVFLARWVSRCKRDASGFLGKTITYWMQMAFLIVSMSPFRLHCEIPVSLVVSRMRSYVTYHIEVEVCDLALAVTAQGETVGQSPDAVFSGVKRLFAVMREGGFRVLEENKRRNMQRVRPRFRFMRFDPAKLTGTTISATDSR